jgi:hypothetical protein
VSSSIGFIVLHPSFPHSDTHPPSSPPHRDACHPRYRRSAGDEIARIEAVFALFSETPGRGSSRGKIDKGTLHQLQSEIGIANGNSIMNGLPTAGIKEKIIGLSLTNKHMKSSKN